MVIVGDDLYGADAQAHENTSLCKNDFFLQVSHEQ